MFVSLVVAIGEENVQSRYIQSRGNETDQPGGSRGRGGRELFPRIPKHAGGVTLPEGESEMMQRTGMNGNNAKRRQNGCVDNGTER